MMELFKLCKHLKTPLCRPRKRVPNWPVTTNLVRKFLINPSKVLVEEQEDIENTPIYSLSGCAISVIGWRRIFSWFFLNVDLLLRPCGQVSNEGKSVIPLETLTCYAHQWVKPKRWISASTPSTTRYTCSRQYQTADFQWFSLSPSVSIDHCVDPDIVHYWNRVFFHQYL